MMNRRQLRESLQHGAIKEISQKNKISYATIQRFLSDENFKNDRVEIVILEYLVEIEKKKTELYAQLGIV